MPLVKLGNHVAVAALTEARPMGPAYILDTT
jgi:hypothetical protein